MLCAERYAPISPVIGQWGPLDQKAGQVPHPVGMCTASRMINAPVYEYLVVILMDIRLAGTCDVVSTRMIALPASLTEARPFERCKARVGQVSTREKGHARPSPRRHTARSLHDVSTGGKPVGRTRTVRRVWVRGEIPAVEERVAGLRGDEYGNAGDPGRDGRSTARPSTVRKRFLSFRRCCLDCHHQC